MNTALTVVLIVLKLLGAVLLFLVALVLLISLLPMGAKVEYRPDALTVDAVIGPLRLRFWPRGGGKKEQAAAQKAAPPAESPAPPKTTVHGPAKPPAAQAAPSPQPPPPAAKPPEEKAEEQPAAPGRMDMLLADLRRDPVYFIGRVLTHAGFAGGRLLRGVRVRDLWVYWTVTGADAAATAEQYGALLAALNNLLVRAREYMDIRAEELWLEPDFTGEQRSKRHIACQVTMRPIVLLALAPRLVWRIWRDPVLKTVLPFTKVITQPQT